MFAISGSSSAMYNYDSNGNVRYDTHRGIGYIIYDPNNLPVYAYLTNGQQLVYENDVNGSRVRNTISGTSDNFYFNGVEGNTLVPMGEAVSTVAHGSNLIYNILGAGGDNIGQVKVVSQSPTRYYYLKDHLGSIKVTVNTSGTVVGYDDYYPYGLQMSGRSSVSTEDGRYKFVSNERDASTGLDHLGDRNYDSWSGRELSIDPFADGASSISPYSYALNNPIIFFDANGDSTRLVGNEYVIDPVDAIQNDKRNISSAGIIFIKNHEGFEKKTYGDVASNKTIGYGHLLRGYEIIKYKGGISEQQAETLLEKDVQDVNNIVNSLVNIPLTQAEYDALSDFVFNVGGRNFKYSHLLKYVNSNQIDKIKSAFSLWNKARVDGILKVIPGLENRRQDEANLFLNGNY